MRRLAVFAALLFSLASFAHAQRKESTPRKESLPPRYSKWVNEEVVYIITDEERKAFLGLNADEQRDRFIQDFWDTRNPAHGSSINSYKEEHYRRLEFATANFGKQSNTPGWKTDMGRAYILFGKPASRTPFIGFGQVYPLELWFYTNTTGVPTVPTFFSLIFYIPYDAGEYIFYRPFLDGPLKLVRGTQFNTNKDVYNFLLDMGGDLARASMTLIPGDPIDNQEFTPSMASDMLVSKIQNLSNDTFYVRRIREMRMMQEHVNSFFLAADQRPLDLNWVVLADPGGQYWFDYSVLIDKPEFGRPEADGKSMTLALSYRLTSESGETVIEDAQERAYTAYEARDGEKKFLPFQIANRLPVVPGKYRLEIDIAQRQSGKSYHGQQVFTVGNPNGISISGPLLVEKAEPVQKPESGVPFQYFGAQFHPAGRHLFSTQEPLRLLFQLETADAPQDYDIEYVLAHTQFRESRKTATETITASQFRERRLLSSKAIPLNDLAEGEYRVVMNVRKSGSPEILSSANVALRIGAATGPDALYFDPTTRKIAQPGVSAYLRALGAFSQKQPDLATAYLKQSVEQNPANPFATDQLVRSYFASRRYGDVATLYNKLGAGPFEKSSEAMSQISLSFWNAGDKERAKEILRNARTAFPEDPLIAAAGKTIR
jgi:GWxTD domain-containing protein